MKKIFLLAFSSLLYLYEEDLLLVYDLKISKNHMISFTFYATAILAYKSLIFWFHETLSSPGLFFLRAALSGMKANFLASSFSSLSLSSSSSRFFFSSSSRALFSFSLSWRSWICSARLFFLWLTCSSKAKNSRMGNEREISWDLGLWACKNRLCAHYLLFTYPHHPSS